MNNSTPKQRLAQGLHHLKSLQKYTVIAFLVLLVGVYGFIIYRIQSVTNQQPATSAINSQVSNAHVPRIDPTIIQQLNSLQDNSVSVQSLFEAARNNPFQESL